jgi:two-component system chemotaxis sensor kinase CheA
VRSTAAAPNAAAGVQPTGPNAAAPRTIRVDVARLDHAMELAGGLSIARGRLAAAIDRGNLAQAGEALEAADTLFRELEAQVLALRLVPLGASFDRMRRAVRDLGLATAKDVHLELSCDDVEVDMAVAEALRAPLSHLIRNAIDHGIELPAVRTRKGKPAQGRVTLAARHEGGHLVVELSDDGAGLDRAALIARAAALGIDATDFDDEQIGKLAFAPGLSTAPQVGDLSGRGVGMDVVRRAIEGLRGSVHLRGVPDAGVTVTLRLPLALSIMQGLAVGIDDQTYVLPLDNVVECVSLDRARAIEAPHGGVLELRGDALPYLDVGHQLGVAGRRGRGGSVVVVEHDGRRAGLQVDELRGEIQTVIRPVGRLFEHVRGVAGSAILGDGQLALVVDVRGLVRAAQPPTART